MTTGDLLDAISNVDVKYTDEAAAPLTTSSLEEKSHPRGGVPTILTVAAAAFLLGLLTAVAFAVIPGRLSPAAGPGASPSHSGIAAPESQASGTSSQRQTQPAPASDTGVQNPGNNVTASVPHDIHPEESESVLDAREFPVKIRKEGSALLRIFVLYHPGAYRDRVTLTELCDTDGNLLDSFRTQGIAVFCLRENDFSEPYTVLSVFYARPNKDKSVEFAYFDFFAAEAGSREGNGKVRLPRSNGLNEIFRYETPQEQAQYGSKFISFTEKAKTRLGKLAGSDIVCMTDQFGYSTYGPGEKKFGQETVDFFCANKIGDLTGWLEMKN